MYFLISKMPVLDQMISTLLVCVMIAKSPPMSYRSLCNSQFFLPYLFSAHLGLTPRELQTYQPQSITLDTSKNRISFSYSSHLNKNEKNILRQYMIQSRNRQMIFSFEFLDTMCEPSGYISRTEMVMEISL